MIRSIVLIPMSFAYGCSMGSCGAWEVDSSYAGSNIHGMVVCKDLIMGYDMSDDELIYREINRILRESDGRYTNCRAIDKSLIISTRNNQIFLKIDCS